MRSTNNNSDGTTHLTAFDLTQVTNRANRSNPAPGDPCHPLAASARAPVIAFKESQSGTREACVHATLDANKGSRRMEGVRIGMFLRQLMPAECERLQGMPGGYTAITRKSGAAADAPRYSAVGNTMATCVMHWIGRRAEKGGV